MAIRRTATVAAVNLVHTYALHNDDMISVLRDFPAEAEKMHAVCLERLSELKATGQVTEDVEDRLNLLRELFHGSGKAYTIPLNLGIFDSGGDWICS